MPLYLSKGMWEGQLLNSPLVAVATSVASLHTLLRRVERFYCELRGVPLLCLSVCTYMWCPESELLLLILALDINVYCTACFTSSHRVIIKRLESMLYTLPGEIVTSMPL